MTETLVDAAFPHRAIWDPADSSSPKTTVGQCDVSTRIPITPYHHNPPNEQRRSDITMSTCYRRRSDTLTRAPNRSNDMLAIVPNRP